MEKCKGVITRERVTKTRVERAVIDFVIYCNRIKEYVSKMEVDEERIHVLTKYASKKGTKKLKQSDHNIMFCKFSIQVEEMPRTLRKEFFQLKNIQHQEKFQEETSYTDKLTSSWWEVH